MQDLICQAIREKRLLELQYDGHARRVAPHIYGIDAAGEELLSCYEVWGGTRRRAGGLAVVATGADFAAEAHEQALCAATRNISAATAIIARVFCQV